MMELKLLSTLRGGRSGRTRSEGIRCDLCAAPIDRTHDHLAEPEKGRILCACPPCSLLFPARDGSRMKRVPREVRALPDFDPEGMLWAGLGVPVGLAFFFPSSVAGRMVAVYPGPAGPTTAPVDPGAWRRLAERLPAAGRLEPDLEALLLHRLEGARDAFLVPIDLAYELVGRLRLAWTGISGGPAVRREINGFLTRLRERAQPPPEEEVTPHA